MSLSMELHEDSPNTETLEMWRVTDQEIVCTYKDTRGVVIDITGAVIQFTVVTKAGALVFRLDTTAGIAIAPGAGGVFTVTFTDTTLGIAATEYRYDIDLTLAADTVLLASGKFRVRDTYGDVV